MPKCNCQKGNHASAAAVLSCKRSRALLAPSSEVKQVNLVHRKKREVSPEIIRQQDGIFHTRNNVHQKRSFTLDQLNQYRREIIRDGVPHTGLNLLQLRCRQFNQLRNDPDAIAIVTRTAQKKLNQAWKGTQIYIRMTVQAQMLSMVLQLHTWASVEAFMLNFFQSGERIKGDAQLDTYFQGLCQAYYDQHKDDLGQPSTFDGRYQPLARFIQPVNSRNFNAYFQSSCNIAELILSKSSECMFGRFMPIFLRQAQNLAAQQFQSTRQQQGYVVGGTLRDKAKYKKHVKQFQKQLRPKAASLLRLIYNRSPGSLSIKQFLGNWFLVYPSTIVKLIAIAENFRNYVQNVRHGLPSNIATVDQVLENARDEIHLQPRIPVIQQAIQFKQYTSSAIEEKLAIAAQKQRIDAFKQQFGVHVSVPKTQRFSSFRVVSPSNPVPHFIGQPLINDQPIGEKTKIIKKRKTRKDKGLKKSK